MSKEQHQAAGRHRHGGWRAPPPAAPLTDEQAQVDKQAVNQTLDGDAGEPQSENARNGGDQVRPREEPLSTNVLPRTFPVEGGTSTPGRFKKGINESRVSVSTATEMED